MEVIEQALYGVAPLRGYGFLATSAGFKDAWKVPAEKLCTSYGERPAGILFPGALFALPLVAGWVAIVEVRDQGTDDLGRPGSLEFRLLAVPEALYSAVGGDPFWIAGQFAPDWSTRSRLPSLPLSAGPPPRTVNALRPILQRDDSSFLLGGTQALLDGSRVFLHRAAPEPELVRALWALLPDRSRETMWPCTYTFRPRSEFHLQVAPRHEPILEHMLTEEQAADYPEGRYELGLQSAVESNDEPELQRLLQRPSRQQMLNLALLLLGLFLLLAVGMAFLRPQPPEKPPTEPPQEPPKVPAQVSSSEKQPRTPSRYGLDMKDRPTFAADEVVPSLPADEQGRALAEKLQALAQRRGFTLPAGNLTLQLEALDAHLPSTPGGDQLRREALERLVPRIVGLLAGDRSGRLLGAALGATAGTGQLRDQGPIERQLRFLLWKHGSSDYKQQGPNTLELLEKLEKLLP